MTADADMICVQRPWGSYTVLADETGFKVKRLDVLPGASLSLQMHHQRSEHWVVVNGVAEIVNGDAALLLYPGEYIYIPTGCAHRLSNPGPCITTVIEVQCGAYLGEDDIVRFDDLYDRVLQT
jgi:mannose-1-phosphate guanylyltransferase